MSRLTKKEKLEAQAAAEQEQYEQIKANWTLALLKELHRVTEHGGEIKASENQFNISFNQHGGSLRFELPFELPEFTVYWPDFQEYCRLVNELAFMDTIKAEEERKAKIRLTALNKLTEEERSILGV